MSNSVINQRRVVFCEGKINSPDALVYRQLLIPSPNHLTIEPIGGKQSVRNFIKGYIRENTNTSIALAVIIDRDLDRPHQNGSLVQFDKKEPIIYLTGLTCIESYFLDTEMMWRFIQEFSPQKNKPDEYALLESLDKTIKEIANYQAIRWALQDVRHDLIDTGKHDFMTMNRLDLAIQLFEEKKITQVRQKDENELLKQALLEIDKLKRALNHINQKGDEYLKNRYEHYRDVFKQFSAQRADYKLWFHGKDTILLWWSSDLISKCSVKKETYYQEFASKIPFEKYPDLIEFRDICWGQKTS